MITHTKLFVEIGNETVDGCIALELSQMVHGHHFFRASFNGENIENDADGMGEDSMKKIGLQIKIALYNDNNENMSFKGIITSVKVEVAGNSSQGQIIVFEGYSPTILLDNGPVCYAYTNMDLHQILGKASGGNPANLLKLVIKPLYENEISYAVQYNESCFSFINRMAYRYGEWMYYDGTDMVFGYKKQAVTELIYGYNLKSFNFSMLASPVHSQYTAHSYKTNETKTVGTAKKEPSARGEAKQLHDISTKIWNVPAPAINSSFDEETPFVKQIDDVIHTDVEGSAANKATIRGQSTHPALYPGATIKIINGKGREYGNYTIIEVYHQFSIGGNYINNFTAIPTSILASPNTNTSLFPMADTQPAVVSNNCDPDSLGRVKVKFYWQRDSESQWLRIVMPYTGADKGMYFVPENGEEVMVGFEGGNAEKPYIIGSLYHGKAMPSDFKNEKNNIKAIRTRSGHTVEFNDTDGEETITISDKEGTFIKFNTKEKSLTIKAPEKLELYGKNITITAEEKLELISKDNMTLGSKKNVQVIADGALELQSKKDTTVKVGGGATIEATKDAKINGQNIAISGKMKADIEGMQTSLKGKMTKIQGASGKIDVM